jgi:hypothetical protein
MHTGLDEFHSANHILVSGRQDLQGGQTPNAGSIPSGTSAFMGTTIFAKVIFTARRTGKAVVGFDRRRTPVVDSTANTDILENWDTTTLTVKR